MPDKVLWTAAVKRNRPMLLPACHWCRYCWAPRSWPSGARCPLSLSGACHEDVAASTIRRHAGLSIARVLLSPGQSWAGDDHPQLFSARLASVFQFFVASLRRDPECRPGELGSCPRFIELPEPAVYTPLAKGRTISASGIYCCHSLELRCD